GGARAGRGRTGPVGEREGRAELGGGGGERELLRLVGHGVLDDREGGGADLDPVVLGLAPARRTRGGRALVVAAEPEPRVAGALDGGARHRDGERRRAGRDREVARDPLARVVEVAVAVPVEPGVELAG